MEILAKVKMPFETRSRSTFKNLPNEFPIPSNTLWCQKYNGRLCNLTHTGILESTMEFSSKPRNQGIMNRPALPQNHGPLFNA